MQSNPELVAVLFEKLNSDDLGVVAECAAIFSVIAFNDQIQQLFEDSQSVKKKLCYYVQKQKKVTEISPWINQSTTHLGH